MTAENALEIWQREDIYELMVLHFPSLGHSLAMRSFFLEQTAVVLQLESRYWIPFVSTMRSEVGAASWKGK